MNPLAMLFVCAGAVVVPFATTSCAQLPSSAAVVSAMRCPAYPDTQFLDPEKFDIGTLTPGGCHPDVVADGAPRANRTTTLGWTAAARS
jgi:hypothetical protein